MGHFKSFARASLTLVAVVAAAPAARAQEQHETPPKVSIALERVGGVSYLKGSDKDTSAGASVTIFGVGGVMINPYGSPRLGVDVLLDPGVTVGASASIQRFSLSDTDTTGRSTDVGSVFLYTLTPRVGYRIPVSPEFDITPRGGLTLAGGSVSSGTSNDSGGVFAMALAAEGVGAYRITKSFNALAGVAFDYTLTASASATSGTSGNTQSQDFKGSFWGLQLWLGLGGYL